MFEKETLQNLDEQNKIFLDTHILMRLVKVNLENIRIPKNISCMKFTSVYLLLPIPGFLQ